jgi:YD repeat-containing protein
MRAAAACVGVAAFIEHFTNTPFLVGAGFDLTNLPRALIRLAFATTYVTNCLGLLVFSRQLPLRALGSTGWAVGVARYDSGLEAHRSEAAGPFSEHPPRSRSFGQQGVQSPFPSKKSRPRAKAKTQVSARHSHARYDSNGNLVTQIAGTSRVTMLYDHENRLVGHREGSALTTYTYSADGLKRCELSPAGVTTLVWDGVDYLQERS